VHFVDDGDKLLLKWREVVISIEAQPDRRKVFETGTIDIFNALWNNGPYTGVYTAELNIPAGVIPEGAFFHLCLEEKSSDQQLSIAPPTCFYLENTAGNKPVQIGIPV
jgi:hypothetical protein